MVEQPRAPPTPTSTPPLEPYGRERPRQRIRYIDQSHIPVTEAASIRLNEAITGRVRCPVQLNDLSLDSICDSGNNLNTLLDYNQFGFPNLKEISVELQHQPIYSR